MAICHQLKAQSIKDLDFLIGTWDISETIYPNTDKAWQEPGIRKCESKTKVSTSGKKRYYAYLINYDKKEKCFWVTSLANDFPLHGKHKWYLDKEKKLINAISPINVTKDRFFRGPISYKDKDKIVWNGWASK